MDPIGNISFASLPAPAPAAAAAASTPVLGDSTQATQTTTGSNNDQPSLASLEQRREEAVQKAAESAASQYPLGDSRFTIFKDATGQYITRFTSLRDGKVTYMPEPQLLRTSDPSVPAVKIEA